MTNIIWLLIIIVAFIIGWFLGQWVVCTRYFRKRIIGTIVYVDKDSEEVTIQFNSEEAVHKMKDLNCVVFTVKSLE